MKLAYFYVTEQGKHLSERIRAVLGGDCYGKENLKEQIAMAMKHYDGIVFVMATGIVVRMIAPYVVHKAKDPAIVVLDQKGNYVISLLSGHLGGANELAKTVAQITNGQAVITTATDVEQVLAFDVFAKEHEMKIENIEQLKYISGALLQKKVVEVVCESEEIRERLKEAIEHMGAEHTKKEEKNESYICFVEKIRGSYGVVISPYRKKDWIEIQTGEEEPSIEAAERHILYLRPKVVAVGIGCKKDRDRIGVKEALEQLLEEQNLSRLSLKAITTIPRKAKEEAVEFLVTEYEIPLVIKTEEMIQQLDLEQLGIAQSAFVNQTVGVASVSTACAYLTSNQGKILVDKRKFTGFTLSLGIDFSFVY